MTEAEKEREEIAAWLREMADGPVSRHYKLAWHQMANAIESGAHCRHKNPEGFAGRPYSQQPS